MFCAILGTLLHFTFKWSNENLIIGAFSAVNESTWEHLKLLFFPMLFSTIITYFFINQNRSTYIFSRTVGIVFSLIFTIIFFYTYTGILGFNIGIINILLFFFSLFLGETLSFKILKFGFSTKNNLAIILILLLISFIVFTYYPPKIGLFEDPITKTYGIN